MVATLQRPIPVPPAAPAEVDFHAGLLTRRAEALAATPGGDRESLESLRAEFLARLHRASDDFEATDGLRAVEAALSLIPRPAGLWAWQSRERKRRRGERHSYSQLTS